MTSVSSKKLLNSKWTAKHPENKEKHFIVTDVNYDEDGLVIDCVIEAVISNREQFIDWRSLKNPEQWIQGWK